MNQKGLGKGFGALFMDQQVPGASENLLMVKLSQVEPNAAQPRKSFDEAALAELCDSIRAHGILQQLAVRRISDGRFQIIAGERRWRAARDAGLNEIPVYLVEADDRLVMELALVENLQRQDLNPVEEAEGYRTLIDNFNLTQESVAERVGKSRSAVANALRLLSLADVVRCMVADGQLSVGHAKALLALTDEDAQISMAKSILEHGYSVRQTELLIKKVMQEKLTAKEPPNRGISVNYLESIERRLSTNLGRKVRLISGRKKGRIELEFYDMNDLEKLLGLFDASSGRI
ncbi:MAG: ParB/RepB/Spo0J family partition protein [Clostridia bacterium]